MEKNAYIRFDWAIKHLLRDKANYSVLEGLLTVLFNDKAEIVEILENEDNHLLWDDAQRYRIDLKIKDSTGELALARIQNMRKLYYIERILNGIPGETVECQGVEKVYSISILYFDWGKGNDYLYHGRDHFIGLHSRDELLISAKEEAAIGWKLSAGVFPEYYLIRLNEFNQEAKTPLEEWVRYLKTGIIDPDTTTPGLLEAREKFRYYDLSPRERYAYDEHINAIMIQNDVLEAAWLEGLEEARAERNSQVSIEDYGKPEKS